MSQCSPNRIVEAVAQARDVEPSEMELSLYEYIDVDAINHLCSRENASWTLTFELPSHDVTVTGDGQVLVDGARQAVWS